MPPGVAPALLGLLDDDRRIAARRAGSMLALVLVLSGAAWALWSPWGLLVHAGAVGLGALAGSLLSRAVHHRYEADLKRSWAEWMEAAPGSRSVAEVARRVTARRPAVHPLLRTLAVLGIALVEAALLVLAVQEDADALQAVPVLAWQGLVVGTLWIQQWRVAAWRRTFFDSLHEMIDEGELGVA